MGKIDDPAGSFGRYHDTDFAFDREFGMIGKGPNIVARSGRRRGQRGAEHARRRQFAGWHLGPGTVAVDLVGEGSRGAPAETDLHTVAGRELQQLAREQDFAGLQVRRAGLHQRRRQRRFHVLELHHQRIGPAVVVVEALGPHDGNVQPVRPLLEARTRIDRRLVFHHAVVLSEHADPSLRRRLDGMEHKLPALAPRPGWPLRDDGMKRPTVLVPGEPDRAFVGHDPRPHALDGLSVGETPGGELAEVVLLLGNDAAVGPRPEVEQKSAPPLARVSTSNWIRRAPDLRFSLVA